MSEIQPPVDAPINGGGGPATVPAEPSKRQRRPSVRLGDQITYESQKKGSQNHQSKSSKTRHLDTWNNNTDPSKSKTKRIRSNWRSKSDNNNNEEEMYDYDYDDADRYTDNSLNLSDDDEGNRVRVSDSSDLDRNGVRVWLNQLGLSRYFSIFQVHEVDDQVLPLLTLEDLKDMGINAVGSRRKMFSSIQKLGKRCFS